MSLPDVTSFNASNRPKIGEDWPIYENYHMISAQGQAESKTYNFIIGKSRTLWLYPIDPDDPNCYCSGGPGSRGFGGSEIEFKLDPAIGGKIILKGPWHSNADAMFRDTGIDRRDKFLTFGIIAEERVYISNVPEGDRSHYIFKNVLFCDKEPTRGTFDRVRDVAKRMANERGKPVACMTYTEGGSSNGYEYPEGWSNDDVHKYHHPDRLA